MQPDSLLRIKLAKAGPMNATVQICYGMANAPCGEPAALSMAWADLPVAINIS